MRNRWQSRTRDPCPTYQCTPLLCHNSQCKLATAQPSAGFQTNPRVLTLDSSKGNPHITCRWGTRHRCKHRTLLTGMNYSALPLLLLETRANMGFLFSPPRSASYSTGSDPNLMYPMGAGMPGNGVPLSGHESGQVRVVQTRPKPQCWEHGCNGRQFSTFSNLLRHQREKSGQASKATCPNCGAEFTRTTARNGHLLQGKCKKRGASDDAGQPLSRSPSASSLADDVRQLHDPALRD